MSVGLVLGGGGIVGAAWLVGALQALENETAWSAGTEEAVAGTSAGALVGALLAAGVPLSEMRARDGAPRDDSLASRLTRVALRPGTIPRPGPGSWRLALATGRRPRSHPLGVVMAGWLPRGIADTDPIEDLVRDFAGEAWPERFWSIAADYATGRRVVLGHGGQASAPFPVAVAASCAIPGVYAPVAVGGRLLVDGGICSVSNLDVMRNTDAEVIVGLNPLSSWAAFAVGTPLQMVSHRMRSQLGRRLGHEARKLRADGRQVILLQPGPAEVALMGTNYLSGRRCAAIAAQAEASVAAALRQSDLPATLRRRQASSA
jgi:NTE family protein